MKIILIDAIWCSGCIVMKKIWKEFATIYPEIELVKLDYDFDEEEVMPYEPGRILPVAVFLDENNKEITRLIGEKYIEEILNIVEGR